MMPLRALLEGDTFGKICSYHILHINFAFKNQNINLKYYYYKLHIVTNEGRLPIFDAESFQQ